MIPTPAMPITPVPAASDHPSARLVDVEGRALPLVAARLTTRAGGGVARVLLEQRFHNPHDEPLRVTYQLPLPADAAVSGFVFTIGEERIRGQIRTREAARAQLEAALLEGRSGALVEQDRSSIFRQEVGNLPPFAEVTVELELDQLLAWRDGGWEWRFPTTISPAFLGSPGRTPDAPRRTVDVADGDPGARLALDLRIDDELVSGPPRSPAHELAGPAQALRFADPDGVRLDRDVVVRWPVAAPSPGAALQVARPQPAEPAAEGGAPGDAYALLTLVPPAAVAPGERVARDLVVLLDTSGSMHGEPLDQARRVTLALIDTLEARDRLELIAFGSSPRHFRRAPLPMTAANRQEAIRWVEGLQAGGGTMMRDGILAALAPLRPDAQRQILLVTDGLIGFESEIVEEIRARLPAQSRVHTLGVGHGVNRSLTGPAARAGAGRELIVAPGEDVEPVVAELLAHTDAPVVVDLQVHGSAVLEQVPRRLPDLYAGAPARIGLRLAPGGGSVSVSGRTASGTWTRTLQVPATRVEAGNTALVTRFGRELVEDLELDRCALGAEVRSIDAQIERAGLQFQIVTRRTSFVATTVSRTVDAASPTRAVHQPHELTHGLSAEGVGLRAVGAVTGAVLASMAPAAPQAMPGAAMPLMAPAGAPRKAKRRSVTDAFNALAGGLFGGGHRGDAGKEKAEASLDAFSRADLEEDAAPQAESTEPAPAPPAAPEHGQRPAEALVERRRGGGSGSGRKGGGVLRRLLGGRPGPRLRGRVVLAAEGKIVIEIAVDEAVPWRPRETVMTAGTLERSPKVDLAASTRAGEYGAGQTLRLVLLEDEVPDALRVGNVEIELTR